MSTQSQVLPPRYACAERIGRGGMGDIYLAEDRQLGRQVAVKLLAERFASDESIRGRFTREALAAARLSGHPHIVTIFDVGEWSGRPFFVMEYFADGTLADRIRRGNVTPAQAFDWLEEAAGALDAAHREGIVHRDVKPANLLFDGRGELNVADFGIARILDQTTAAGMTAPGTILGTSGYLSPEQANGEEATSASDIYALGVVAYELLTGERPFQRPSATAEAVAHIHEPVPLASARNRELPTEVDDVFQRALAKDPAERHATAGELVEDLRAGVAALDQDTGPIRVPATVMASEEPDDDEYDDYQEGPEYARPRRSWLLPGVLAALMLGAGGVAAAALLTDGDGGGNAVTLTVPVTQRVEVTAQGRTITQATTVFETTVEEEPEPPPPPPPTPPATPPPSPPPSGAAASYGEGVRLTDQATAANNAGNYTGALSLMERALPALRGTGQIYEAYGYYNYANALLNLGRCAEARTYLDRSERIQGARSQITRARARARAC